MGSATPDNALAATQLLADRCAELGLPVWCLDAKGAILQPPKGFGPADLWLRSGLLGDLISSAVAVWRTGDDVPPIDLICGCWLVPVVTNPSHPEAGMTMIMALGEALFDTEQFQAICASSQLDPGETKAALAPCARYCRSDLEYLIPMLRWMHADLDEAAANRRALRDFSGQLAHAFEQISLLYRLGRSMNCLADPVEFIRMTCALLRDTLDFEWVAVKLASDGPVPEIVDALVCSGDLSVDQNKFGALAAQLIGELDTDQWTKLLECNESELAAHVKSQVVAEPIVSSNEVTGLLLAGDKRGPDPEVTSVETQLLDAAADFLGAFLHNVAMYVEQRGLFLGTLKALTAAIDAKDPYTFGHSERVALLGSQLARACDMDVAQAERVRIAGLVHDVGKIGVPEAVLGKPGRLTEAEFELIKRHPRIGYNILKDLTLLADVLPGVLYHHERWDGQGYPEGLSGENTPLLGRLLAVADAFDAMSSDRRYRSAMTRQQVLNEIADCAGTQFDPRFAKVFLTLDLTEYDALVASHRAQDSEAA
ncbi:MAG: HD domain-containing phosphohydrolase [Phycisphaerales bacterium]